MCGGGALAIFWHAARNTDLTRLVGGGALSAGGVADAGTVRAVHRPAVRLHRRRGAVFPAFDHASHAGAEAAAVQGRTRAAALLILLCIPATLYLGFRWLGNTGYYPVAFAVLLECMVPFFPGVRGTEATGP